MICRFCRLLEPAAFTDFAKPNRYPATELAKLSDVYPFFDVHRLKNELLVVYENTTFLKRPSQLLEMIIQDDLSEGLPEVTKLLKLMLTIPVTSVSAERSFSCLKRVKTYLRNTCKQERLTDLSIISMESSVIRELKSKGTFYDAVIDTFSALKDRRVDFLYR